MAVSWPSMRIWRKGRKIKSPLLYPVVYASGSYKQCSSHCCRTFISETLVGGNLTDRDPLISLRHFATHRCRVVSLEQGRDTYYFDQSSTLCAHNAGRRAMRSWDLETQTRGHENGHLDECVWVFRALLEWDYRRWNCRFKGVGFQAWRTSVIGGDHY